MKSINKILILGLVIFTLLILESCANARVSGGVGMDVRFGPNGPRVVPSLNLDVYNGGRL